ncbi:MAG: hypothetical protein NTW21_34115 [Verrucomicrobia bacterium]|nr:hypothetical protein [Verrucomicrobiota bacterium]
MARNLVGSVVMASPIGNWASCLRMSTTLCHAAPSHQSPILVFGNSRRSDQGLQRRGRQACGSDPSNGHPTHRLTPPVQLPLLAPPAATPARLNFLHRLESLAIRPAARDYYVRWAEAWINPPNGLMSDDC